MKKIDLENILDNPVRKIADAFRNELTKKLKDPQLQIFFYYKHSNIGSENRPEDKGYYIRAFYEGLPLFECKFDEVPYEDHKEIEVRLTDSYYLKINASSDIKHRADKTNQSPYELMNRYEIMQKELEKSSSEIFGKWIAPIPEAIEKGKYIFFFLRSSLKI